MSIKIYTGTVLSRAIAKPLERSLRGCPPHHCQKQKIFGRISLTSVRSVSGNPSKTSSISQCKTKSPPLSLRGRAFSASNSKRCAAGPSLVIKDGVNLFWQGPAEHHLTPISRSWLRDHCQCTQCFHQITRQRLFNSLDLQRASKDVSSCSQDGTEVKIIWADGHESRYPLSYFTAKDVDRTRKILSAALPISYWDNMTVSASPPTTPYQSIISSSSDDGVKDWLRNIRTHGLAFVSDVPVSPEATQHLIERIAFIRHTHYGGFWDFTADLAKGDTAYTNLALDAHNDNCYFSDPSGLQLFHLLQHDGQGGESLFVDGFHAAQLLKTQDPAAYRILSEVRLYWHASGNNDSSYTPWTAFPVLNHDPATDALTQIRWNEADRASFATQNADEIDRWYAAAATWQSLLQRPELEYWVKLVPGTPVIFDNWRVLHGRAAFDGTRRMCGGYINRDDWTSRLKMLEWGREVVLEATV